MGEQIVVTPPANPGLNGTAYVFDTTANPGTAPASGVGDQRKLWAAMGLSKIIVTIYADQIVTFHAQSLRGGSTSWTTVNGAGSGEATTANTYFERTFDVGGADSRVTIVCTTAPTVWNITCKLVMNDKGGA